MNTASNTVASHTRRSLFHVGAIAAAALAFAGTHPAVAQTATGSTMGTIMQVTQDWDKTFARNNRVDHQKVSFRNRYGITLVGDLYLPKDRGNRRLPAIVLAGPFGAVKEQSSGLYAQEMAARGFATLAFDPSYTGESGGAPRNLASPDINTEDFSAAVDFIGLPLVDRNRIGMIGICGYSGMALTAATSDSRVKAVATASMYDMSRSMSLGSNRDNYTLQQRRQVIDYLSQQRWADAESGTPARGLHEVPFDNEGNLVRGERVLPETLPAGADPVTKSFFDYYRTPRGYHPRGINSNTAWTATTPMSFFAFPMYASIEMIAPRPILLIAGENAHSRYHSEDAFKAATGPKELHIVPGANHVDLYDRHELIPFDKLQSFFTTHLAAATRR